LRHRPLRDGVAALGAGFQFGEGVGVGNLFGGQYRRGHKAAEESGDRDY